MWMVKMVLLASLIVPQAWVNVGPDDEGEEEVVVMVDRPTLNQTA